MLRFIHQHYMERVLIRVFIMLMAMEIGHLPPYNFILVILQGITVYCVVSQLIEMMSCRTQFIIQSFCAYLKNIRKCGILDGR